MILSLKQKLVLRNILSIYIYAASETEPDDHLTSAEEIKEMLDDELEDFTPTDMQDLFDDAS